MESLALAIEMEREAKRFYQDAALKTNHNLGRSLYTRLAMEEDFHAAKAKEIWENLSRSEDPLAIEESLDYGREIRQIFSDSHQRVTGIGEVPSGEWDIIQTALEIEEKSRIEIELVGEDDEPIPGEPFKLELPDGKVMSGTTGPEGVARITGIEPGTCKICFTNLDEEAWEKI